MWCFFSLQKWLVLFLCVNKLILPYSFLHFSLLKVHMQLKEFSVFIDVERLEAGKFDNNLLNSIRQARNFLLVLTPNALDRCIGDNECKDWVHRVSWWINTVLYCCTICSYNNYNMHDFYVCILPNSIDCPDMCTILPLSKGWDMNLHDTIT